MKDIGHVSDINNKKYEGRSAADSNIVLEKDIFSNIFGKDIRRVYIYKKAERLAKALQMIAPAFRHSPALRDRVDHIAVDLIDAAIEGPGDARVALSAQILALSSMLEMARVGGILSPMNSEIISREAKSLLQEIAAYEDPRIELGDVPSLPLLQKSATGNRVAHPKEEKIGAAIFTAVVQGADDFKGQVEVKDRRTNTSRREQILSMLGDKKEISIKDISLMMQGISEKTVQRELQSLVQEGVLDQKGTRRWTTYSLKV